MRLLAAIVLFAFGAGAATAAEPSTTLTVWAMGAEGKKIREMADRFEQLNPGVTVVTQAIPWSGAHEKIMTSVIGGIPPDVCQMGTTWMAEFSTIGALEALEPYLAQSSDVSVNQFFPGALETNRVNGRLYGLPWYVDTRILFYRADILRQAGFPNPPKTWDELLAVCRALKKTGADGNPERFGIAMSPTDWGEFLPLFWQIDGRLLNDDMTAVDIDRSKFIEAMTFYKKFFDEGLTPLTQGAGMDLLHAFKTGYYPMFVSGPWSIAEVETKMPELAGQWAVTPRPGKINRKSFIGGCNLVTFQKSKHKDWAWKFISYMSRPDVQASWFELTTDLPSTRDAWNADAIKRNPHLSAFRQQLEWTQAPPNHPSWEQMAMNVIGRVQEKIVLGKITVEEGYDLMVRDLNQILDRSAAKQSMRYKIAVCGGILLIMLMGLLAYFYTGKSETGQWSPTNPIQAVPFVLPALILLCVFLFIPIMTSLVISITNWDIYSLNNLSNLRIVGLDNYRRILTQDAVFQKSVFNTFIFVIVAVPLTITAALGMAMVVNSGLLKFKAVFRTGFFIPVITTMVAVAVIWKWLYNPQFGMFNLTLEHFGFQPQNWLGDERLALPSLILMAVWKNFGYNMIIFIAGLQAIPVVLYEAADIDGVSAWQRFRHITLPMLKPSMIFVCITTVIGYFQFFAEPYIMTEGGPNNATNSIVLYTYHHAFKFYNLGYASAISYLLFTMTLAFSLMQIWYARKAEA